MIFIIFHHVPAIFMIFIIFLSFLIIFIILIILLSFSLMLHNLRHFSLMFYHFHYFSSCFIIVHHCLSFFRFYRSGVGLAHICTFCLLIMEFLILVILFLDPSPGLCPAQSPAFHSKVTQTG